ncbi:MAG: hypothetical protein ACKOYN_08440 [Planctomycetota bacterium]
MFSTSIASTGAAEPPPGRTVDAPASRAVEARSAFTKTRPADAPSAANVDERNREQLGRLEHSKVVLKAEGATLRETLRELRRALGINLVPFFDSGDVGAARGGVDPAMPVTIALDGATGREVLEALAALCGPAVTWQLVNGTVEFGPREILARPTARMVVVLDTRSLAHHAGASYKSQGIGQGRVESDDRRDSDMELGLVMKEIAARCEPEAFDPLAEAKVEDPEGNLVPVRHVLPGRGGNNRMVGRPSNYDPNLGPVFVRGKWAAMQARDNAIMVMAPDFVLRAVEGYGEPIPPREEVRE